MEAQVQLNQSSSSACIDFDDLIYDVKLEIFKYLDRKSLLNCFEVSRK